MKRESHLPELFKHYLNGGWETGATVGLSLNPSDLDEPVGEYVRADARQTDAAIDAASAAFPEWSRSSGMRRAEALDAIGGELLARRAELGRLLAREEGKTLPEAIAEVTRAGHVFRFYAGEALRIGGAHRSWVRPNVDIDITREPLGVIGVVTPWSFPLAIPASKIAPALAFGNCVVFKPAERVPACAWALADIVSRSGLPAGVFNLVLGSGRQAGARIVANPLVQGVCFAGSAATATSVREAAAARETRVQLDTGGKNPLVVLNDADLDTAVDAAIDGAYFSAGQRATASSRLIVEAGMYDRFVDAMLARLATLDVDHALKKSVDIGPLADEAQLRKSLDTIASGRKEGAQLLHGGAPLERATRGFFLQPALFAGTHEMRIAREEIFGPVAVVIRADDAAHALHLANETPRALCAGICTQSLQHATHFRRYSQSALVTVNLPTTGVDHHVPFDNTDFYTTTKTAYVAS
ncbi:MULTISPECIES: aldehyde dehydrogenase family protein [unclassified Caballeronia]|uniref:aldehyde dehydrogenase family protein n=1 Tax=unclassified Caballeronia TaxID=2646786 RepID=UPI00286597EE|nr:MULTISPECIES: aldehyde dehydrogenase family protein [unclassified Caballeronia]MDR5752129.1 aldehyde dehydrogenase family protein [Caballeronia sp. LZ024]MDR5843730.1 aldehyde dehydrogenase family protein [Caballeronia sp. LZ031]